MNLHLESVPLEKLSSVWYPLEEMDHQKQTERDSSVLVNPTAQRRCHWQCLVSLN